MCPRRLRHWIAGTAGNTGCLPDSIASGTGGRSQRLGLLTEPSGIDQRQCPGVLQQLNRILAGPTATTSAGSTATDYACAQVPSRLAQIGQLGPTATILFVKRKLSAADVNPVITF